MPFDLQRFTLVPVPLIRRIECDFKTASLAMEDPAALFPGARDAGAALSGLMLMLGCWGASHELSQANESAEGNYWHAIVHRMEPDYSNSNYWFRRVGRHSIFPELYSGANALLANESNLRWKLKSSWDPLALY